MGILFSLLGLTFLVLVLVVIVLFTVFLARKVGLIKTTEFDEEGNRIEKANHPPKSYVKQVTQDVKKLSNSLIFRFITIGILIVVMMIPLSMVGDVVDERSRLEKNVFRDIESTWGHQQNVKGPSLFIPYTEKYITEEIKTDKDGNERKVNKTFYKQRTAIALPNDLNIDVNLNGESRKRSIYEAIVYSADMNISGDFKRPEIETLSNNIDKIHWDRAWISLGISDTQAINKVSKLDWNNRIKLDFEPGTRAVETLASGFHAPIDLSQDKNNPQTYLPFTLTLDVNGSRGFYFSPFGKKTDVKISSDWPHPSFQGNVLPDQHNVKQDGFTAQWNIPHLARNYPQIWTLENHSYNLNEFNAGVNLFKTVSLYSQITRSIKYGLLFFTLTYITFLMYELGIGRRLHIVQYAVIGLALSMFYLTLLSMAEHSGFFKAYISAAAIIVFMISAYTFAAIRNIPRTILISILLFGLYSVLYSLLKLEDFALMAGTGLLLFILAVLMYLTRNITNQRT